MGKTYTLYKLVLTLTLLLKFLFEEWHPPVINVTFAYQTFDPLHLWMSRMFGSSIIKHTFVESLLVVTLHWSDNPFYIVPRV